MNHVTPLTDADGPAKQPAGRRLDTVVVAGPDTTDWSGAMLLAFAGLRSVTLTQPLWMRWEMRWEQPPPHQQTSWRESPGGRLRRSFYYLRGFSRFASVDRLSLHGHTTPSFQVCVTPQQTKTIQDIERYGTHFPRVTRKFHPRTGYLADGRQDPGGLRSHFIGPGVDKMHRALCVLVDKLVQLEAYCTLHPDCVEAVERNMEAVAVRCAQVSLFTLVTTKNLGASVGYPDEATRHYLTVFGSGDADGGLDLP